MVIDTAKQKRRLRSRRHRRVRARVFGTPERPRLVTFRSNRYLYVQAIDDARGFTLCAADDVSPLKGAKKSTKTERARMVGRAIAEKLKKRNLSRVVFDRGGYAYHGRIRALAEGAREGGLEF